MELNPVLKQGQKTNIDFSRLNFASKRPISPIGRVIQTPRNILKDRDQ